MVDIVDKATRSRMMSGIRGKDTRPEMFLRKGLHRLGFRYRLHVKNLPGKPDLVFPALQAAIQVNGCFWHGHDCHLFKWPKSRPEFWRAKIARNRANDQRAAKELQKAGWRLLTVWECAMKGKDRLDGQKLLSLVETWLIKGKGNQFIKGSENGIS